MMLRRIIRFARGALCALGLMFIVMLGVAFSSLPWDWYRWLAAPGASGEAVPEVIVMMGGGGIPSESGLLRAWKTAEAYALFSNSFVIVAMPVDDTDSGKRGIVYELELRGVPSTRILREPNGRNTREQAMEVFDLLQHRGISSSHTVGLITSPEHVRRTWASFKKAGFTRLAAYPSWAEDITSDMRYDESEMGGASLYGVVGGSMTFRYRLWDNLVVMAKCLRETVALIYYRIMGWI